MTPEEIEHLAMRGDALPNGLNLAEQSLFLSFRCLYHDYHKKLIARDQAQREKRELLRTFEDYQHWIKIYKESFEIRLKLAGMSKEVEQGDCERCKKMMRIFDGRCKL